MLFTNGSPAAGQEQPTVARDSVQVNACTFNVYRGSFDAWSWVPKMEFRVKGLIPSGGQLSAEFTIPGADKLTVRRDTGAATAARSADALL
jgi:hypothetical protein